MDDRTTKSPDRSSPDHRTAIDGGREEERAMQLLQLLAVRNYPAGEPHPSSPRTGESSHAKAESTAEPAETEAPRPPWLDAYVKTHAEPDPAAKTIWKGDKRLAFGFAAALVGAMGAFFYYMTLSIQSPQQVESAVSLPERSLSDAAAPSAAQLVQQAMAECDREAKADPSALYLLLIPVKPNSESAPPTALPGEAYDAFFLLTSQAAIEGLQTNSYTTDSRAFGFAIADPTTRQTKAWNFVTGVTKLVHKAPDGFSDFRVGFDLTGRGHGWQWSGQYSRNPGLCYWVNVHFRLQ
jgi:hypothetical protein